MKKTLLMLMAVVMVGCITIEGGKDFSTISLGMTKEEVLAAKGKPYETAATKGTEYYIYATFLINGNGKTVQDKYYIRFVKGKVDSYGKVGDFDSTQDPTLKLIIEERRR